MLTVNLPQESWLKVGELYMFVPQSPIRTYGRGIPIWNNPLPQFGTMTTVLQPEDIFVVVKDNTNNSIAKFRLEYKIIVSVSGDVGYLNIPQDYSYRELFKKVTPT